MLRSIRIAPFLPLVLALPFHVAAQQAYPSRPIRVVLPQAPGAGIDPVALNADGGTFGMVNPSTGASS